MANNNVDISTELAAILAAIYGEEVRGSIHDALSKMNVQLNDAIDRQVLTIDNTLTVSGQAADAKKTGDEISALETELGTDIEELAGSALLFKGELANGTSLNNVTASGLYRLLASNYYDDDWYNALTGQSPSYLEVIRFGSNISQTLKYFNTSYHYASVYATRISNTGGSSWGAWIPSVDTTLANSGQAADAAITGNRLTYLEDLTNSLADNIGSAFAKVHSVYYSLSEEYDPSHTYIIGDYVTYMPTYMSTGLHLYKCISPTTGEWNASKWEEVTVMDECGSGVGESIADEYTTDTTVSYAVGDYATYLRKLWKCIAATSGAWNSSKWEEVTVMDELQLLRQDMEYTPVVINSFSINPSTVEMGSTLTSIVVSFSINKVPSTLTVNGAAITARKTGSETITGLSVTSNTTYTLTATDEGSPSSDPASDAKTVPVRFYNNRYWGVKAIPTTMNSEFVTGLSKELSGSRDKTFTVNAGSAGNNMYIWYAVPTRLGTCSFKIGGFEGGFESPSSVTVTNTSGFSETYYVYRSTYDGLGTTTVEVS